MLRLIFHMLIVCMSHIGIQGGIDSIVGKLRTFFKRN